jgi:hypothetical protein
MVGPGLSVAEVWTAFAACRTSAIDFDSYHEAAAAIAVCRSCPGRVGCLRAALDRPPTGVIMAGRWWPESTSRARRIARQLRATGLI